MRLRIALHKELHWNMPKVDVCVSARGYQQFLVEK